MLLNEKIEQISEYEQMLFERSPEKRDGVSSSGQVVFGYFLRPQKVSDKKKRECIVLKKVDTFLVLNPVTSLHIFQ